MHERNRPRNGAERTEPMGDHWSSPETADRVLAWFHANVDDADEVEASYRGIAAVLSRPGERLSPITMRRAVNRLIDHGHLELVRAGTGRRYPSRYRLLETSPAAPIVA